MQVLMPDLGLWSRTPSPLQSSWGCVCRAPSHWCTQRTPKSRQKPTITQNTSRTNGFKVTPLTFLAARKLKTGRLSRQTFSKWCDQYAFILQGLIQDEVCREHVAPEKCVTLLLLWYEGWERGALPWIQRGRRHSARCIGEGFYGLAKGHRRTDRWAGRWSSTPPGGNTRTHSQTHIQLNTDGSR